MVTTRAKQPGAAAQGVPPLNSAAVLNTAADNVTLSRGALNSGPFDVLCDRSIRSRRYIEYLSSYCLNLNLCFRCALPMTELIYDVADP